MARPASRLWLSFVGLLLIVGLLADRPALADPSCDAVMSIVSDTVTIETSAVRPPGDFETPRGRRYVALPTFCRVEGHIRPTSDSDIGFELWIPPRNDWNGKLLVVGNGGYVGTIRYDELEPAIRRGYAVISADSGHRDNSLYRNESLDWGVGHPEKIVDWAHRSTHVAKQTATLILERFQDRKVARAYYLGCSTGGGQGLMAAQRYPEDFDGIVAGAPGFNRTGLNMGFLWMAMQNLASKEGYIASSKLEVINRAAIAACDAQDGVPDGIIRDPRVCKFDPGVLTCSGDVDGPDCLTTSQLATLKALYAGASGNVSQVYPGWPIGSEAGYDGGWAYATNGPLPFRLQFFRDWVFKDKTWDWQRFDWSTDPPKVRAAIGDVVDAVDPDLSRFRQRGGKLILFHGWADPIGNAQDTIDYYERVRQKNPDTDTFARLFMAPGMGHCQGGVGPNAFDAIGALDRWVEHGRPPDHIVALKSSKTDRVGSQLIGEPEAGQGMTRPLCPYPAVAAYSGSGDINSASNSKCEGPH